MSSRAEKLEQAGKRTTAGPARCTLAQLRTRWGQVAAPERLWAGAEVTKVTMSGAKEVWRVTTLLGLADEQVHLEQMGGST